MSSSPDTHSVQQSLQLWVGSIGGLRSEWRKRSTRFGFYISFSKFQNLGVAGVVERDYIGETDTLLEDIRLREKEMKKLALCCLTLTIKECQFVL